MNSAGQAILIVDNDHSTRELYQRVLSQDYQVLAVSDEQDVLDLLQRHDIRAVVIEPGPANSRGWRLFAELKRDPATRTIPIIVCTAQDERRRGLALGAAAYLIKPVLPITLLEALRLIV
jgi:DNA-binding response OmpR family regulator